MLHTGYIGKFDTRIVKDGLPILPTLSVGSFNLTYSNYTSVVNSRKIIIVGFSSLSCTKCIAAENEITNYFIISFRKNGIEPEGSIRNVG